MIGQARINAICNIAYMYPITKTNTNNKHVNAAGLPTRYSIGNLMETSTSSTAQGGGGSFKNRKPIGEIGCCESGMAERIH